MFHNSQSVPQSLNWMCLPLSLTWLWPIAPQFLWLHNALLPTSTELHISEEYLWRIGCCHHSIPGSWSISAPKDIISRTILSPAMANCWQSLSSETQNGWAWWASAMCQASHARICVVSRRDSPETDDPWCGAGPQPCPRFSWLPPNAGCWHHPGAPAPPIIKPPMSQGIRCPSSGIILGAGWDITDITRAHSVPPSLAQ